MRYPTSAALMLGASAMLALPAAMAAERVQVVTSFSILADMVQNVGGEHVEVTSLVGPDSDTHVFSPSPRDARSLAEAGLVVFNGLRFEGWMERLIDSSDYAGALVTASDGIVKLDYQGHDHAHAHGHDDHEDDHDDHGHGDHDEHGHDDHDAHGQETAAGHDDHGDDDPHGWQDLAMGKVYVGNIRDGLIEADPDNEAAYRENAERYINELEATDAEIRELLGEVPGSTSVITGHDSFGYFASAYGIRFLSPVGLSTEAEPSAADMARLIDVIREQNVRALFHENMTSPAVINQLAEETGLPIAGTLYADALASEGEASTYLGMMRHNAQVLHDALAKAGHDDREGDDDHGHDDHGHDH
ncbi:zinc ABC transporter solute-binding protein [Halomonas sp. MCCC 1A17488]|uniref:Zinc ABC transporter solute-binding protein n=1 Tax=Billgrantia sulfidoxydans TaxID=2733484 RepID=A0ABX7W1A9_9GAMM|nr:MULTISPECIES: metal ABC transporter substrate-binding protein [Halomonas]MCE8016935.1 zinc ABC transporter solute-binding protein [Halomonas sp. MCCC 1A17488]MCG3240268.1 zinc ABC transporter solute-binding protein [Halomonas sp. MCCC 1A17488]QPP49857.1 zinc ABC transporter substrate-binding protein [Halomonas sp. SS10-MC5]QTP53477.1 zinc ABC transporter solute-binding protein [Halomonas sulfidoxydans]